MSPDRLLAADAVTVAVTHAAGLAEGHAAEGEIMLIGENTDRITTGVYSVNSLCQYNIIRKRTTQQLTMTVKNL